MPKRRKGVLLNRPEAEGRRRLQHSRARARAMCRKLLFSDKRAAEIEKVLESAYQNWNEVKAFNDQNSLLQHLAGLNPHIEKTGACETVGESSSLHSNISSFHSANSTMNLFGDQTAAEDSESSTTGCSDDSFFEGVDECIDNLCGCSRQHDGLMMHETDGGEARIIATSSDSPRRWRKCVSKWFSVRRRVALGVSPDRKKQKVD